MSIYHLTVCYFLPEFRSPGPIRDDLIYSFKFFFLQFYKTRLNKNHKAVARILKKDTTKKETFQKIFQNKELYHVSMRSNDLTISRCHWSVYFTMEDFEFLLSKTKIFSWEWHFLQIKLAIKVIVIEGPPIYSVLYFILKG